MRNPCKHENTKILNPGAHNCWSWCLVCGATRLEIHPTQINVDVNLKWVSPKSALTGACSGYGDA